MGIQEEGSEGSGDGPKELGRVRSQVVIKNWAAKPPRDIYRKKVFLGAKS